MFASGHWRPGRASGRSADIRYAPEAELSYPTATQQTEADNGDFSSPSLSLGRDPEIQRPSTRPP
jgi:hypothetical protein